MSVKMTPNGWVARGIFILFSIILILGGVAALKEGRIHYANYWGGVVFAPFAIVLGLFLLSMAILQWKNLTRRNDSRKLKGKAARLARQAEETKFPIDDYRKW
jgi:quinol-cytochrome oxidoreductase complex cytochrome b subunit